MALAKRNIRNTEHREICHNDMHKKTSPNNGGGQSLQGRAKYGFIACRKPV
jgi:hypothetical protein